MDLRILFSLVLLVTSCNKEALRDYMKNKEESVTKDESETKSLEANKLEEVTKKELNKVIKEEPSIEGTDVSDIKVKSEISSKNNESSFNINLELNDSKLSIISNEILEKKDELRVLKEKKKNLKEALRYEQDIMKKHKINLDIVEIENLLISLNQKINTLSFEKKSVQQELKIKKEKTSTNLKIASKLAKQEEQKLIIAIKKGEDISNDNLNPLKEAVAVKKGLDEELKRIKIEEEESKIAAIYAKLELMKKQGK